MALVMRSDTARREGFAFWRILVWLILLLAAYGCLQYATHAGQLWRALAPLPATDTGDILQLQKMLAWDVLYFFMAFALVVICAGVILRQAWARSSLQMASVLLAVGWGLVGGIMLFLQWREFSQGVALTNAQASLDAASQMALAHMHRSFLMAMGIKALGVPVLLWLAWRLGQPAVRGQFRSLRGRR
ncbi:hypothetical protein [Dyella telluris]|uniref:Uncharacterized protein n=1 Tax=Dyella telluris TaxID=2763498 RepID=A0A7G8PZE8_9GAMM|nr:hypothetical protein [Dyella telluris]QNJ99905.1 hypothetical protein H8F01_12220 [Dyella telluris]